MSRTSQLRYCRLCLEQEVPGDTDKGFVGKLCYCIRDNVHRNCLKRWIIKSGRDACFRCSCPYNIRYQPKSFITYLRDSPIEWKNIVQKAINLASLVHLTLIVLFILIYSVKISSKTKWVLVVLMLFRCFFTIFSVTNFIRNVRENYQEWDKAHRDVIINDLN